MVRRPRRQSALPQEVPIIQPQFLQAGTGHAGQLELALLRGAAGLAALGDVLDARARSLHHLVVRAAALVDETVANGARQREDGHAVGMALERERKGAWRGCPLGNAGHKRTVTSKTSWAI